jgi:type II secretory pathway pseudopilin PulG
MLAHRSSERGDTIIEVIVAVALFSSVLVMTFTSLNQSSAAALRTYEISQVNEQLDAQAQTLRFLHESYVSNYSNGVTYNLSDGATSPGEEYQKVLDKVASAGLTSASPYSGVTSCPSPAPAGSFGLNTRMARVQDNTASLLTATTYAQATYPSGANSPVSLRGIWIEGIRTPAASGRLGFIDFHVRACWTTVGVPVPSNVGTIVRLYDPR